MSESKSKAVGVRLDKVMKFRYAVFLAHVVCAAASSCAYVLQSSYLRGSAVLGVKMVGFAYAVYILTVAWPYLYSWMLFKRRFMELTRRGIIYLMLFLLGSIFVTSIYIYDHVESFYILLVVTMLQFMFYHALVFLLSIKTNKET